MARDRGISNQPVAAVDLRRRASRVRRLMGGMISKADYDRLRDYADDLELRAAAFDEPSARGSAASTDARNPEKSSPIRNAG